MTSSRAASAPVGSFLQGGVGGGSGGNGTGGHGGTEAHAGTGRRVGCDGGNEIGKHRRN